MQNKDWETKIQYASFGIDFDGTIIKGGYPDIGEEYEGAIDVLLEMKRAGHKLILWTCRTADELSAAVNWCRLRGLEFDAVCDNLDEVKLNYTDSRKIVATHYVDDRSVPKFMGWCKFHDWLVENNYL